MLKRFFRNRNAATVVEYSLIVGVLSLTIIAGIGTATNSLVYLFANSESRLNQALDR